MRCAARCTRQAVLRWGGARIGRGSGRRSLAACRARTRQYGRLSPAVGSRWFRQAGGMPPVMLAPLSGRYLSFAEREEIAILHAQELGVREIARRVGRSPSTISRELRRNASTRTYAAATGQRRRNGTLNSAPAAPRSASSRRTTRCASTCRTGSAARSPGQMARPCPGRCPLDRRRHGRRADRRWARSWSPEQIANRLRPASPMMRPCGSRTRRLPGVVCPGPWGCAVS